MGGRGVVNNIPIASIMMTIVILQSSQPRRGAFLELDRDDEEEEVGTLKFEPASNVRALLKPW